MEESQEPRTDQEQPEPTGQRPLHLPIIRENTLTKVRRLHDPHITAVISSGHRNVSSSFSDGVIHPRVCRGQVFSEQGAWSRSSRVSLDMSVPLGKY